jgi:hypothetical protein
MNEDDESQETYQTVALRSRSSKFLGPIDGLAYPVDHASGHDVVGVRL